MVDGIEQEPMDGTSFLYTFDDPNAEERHTVQYFEVIGSRAIYKDGWWACARLDKKPWEFSPAALAPFAPGKWDPEQDTWELYYLPDDFTQAKDLAAENPEKLAELKELFWAEAERNRALPLLGSICVFFGILPPLPTVTRYTFAGDVQNIQKGLVPRIAGRSYAIEAELEIPEGGAEGVILANADFIGGFGLWVDEEGKLNHTYSFLGVESYRQTSTKPLPTGDVTVKMLFEADEPKPGSGGNVTLWANGEQIGEGRVEKTAPMMLTSYAGMDVSRDNGLVVDLAYEDKAPYPFTGTVKKVVFDLKPADDARRREGAARAREHPRRRARSGRIGARGCLEPLHDHEVTGRVPRSRLGDHRQSRHFARPRSGRARGATRISRRYGAGPGREGRPGDGPEEITEVGPGHVIRYRMIKGAPVRDYTSGVALEESPRGGTLVSWDARFRPLVPGTGWAVSLASKHTLNRVLDAIAERAGAEQEGIKQGN